MQIRNQYFEQKKNCKIVNILKFMTKKLYFIHPCNIY